MDKYIKWSYRVLSVVLALILLGVLFGGPVYYWIENPHLTYMQVFLEWWWWWLMVVVFLLFVNLAAAVYYAGEKDRRK